MDRVFIIAEAGVNHNGEIRLAKRMVDAAREAGADAVKFQSFITGNLVTVDAPLADYQSRTIKENSQYDMIKKLELSRNDHYELFDYCRKKSILFLSSPFDLESIDLLQELGLEIFKIPSGEITNLPYLEKIGKLKKTIIISTGMASLGETEWALGILTANGTQKEKITILHCNSEYPTPLQDVNLAAMCTIKAALKVKVGYSDHTTGIEIPLAAVAMGATVIEKHFTLDKGMKGPDHRASLNPDEFTRMVEGIRGIEIAVGSGIKSVSQSERKNRNLVRKSIVAARAIKAGEVYTNENLAVKRPGDGIPPGMWYQILGKYAHKDYHKDEFISFEA